MKKLVLLALVFVLGFWPGSISILAEADEPLPTENKYYSINLDFPTIKKGYTVSGFDNSLKLSLVPEILDEATRVELVELHEELEMPWQLDLASNIYQFEFKNKAAYDNHKPYYIQFAYQAKDKNHKQVFFYDKNYQGWRPLPTEDFPEEKFVRSLIHLPYARIAVFSYPGVLTFGRASWYSYKPGNFAASPDFPKGSRIRVFNLDNNKYVDVVINDYGPDRSLHPDRAIDLEKNAFMKLASLGAGMINVKLQPLYIAPETNGEVLGVNELGVKNKPETKVKSAIIIDEESGETIWEKNSSSTLPLASLTKLISLKVFLDTKPDLNRVVAYSANDLNFNYEHVKPWEGIAKLNVPDGETMTIEDLIYTSIVGSANNTVESLVRVSGLARQDFIANMNELVLSWGASSTHFIEPTGLAPENVSSTADYGIITKEVMKHPVIAKASIAPEYKFTTQKSGIAKNIKNTNYIIRGGQYNVTGSKTGYLEEAGYCLMTRVKAANGHNLIVVTFGAGDRDSSFSETEELIKYGLRENENRKN